MRAFVTGGLGFLGQHLASRLLATGAHVTVYDRHHTPQRIPIADCDYQRGDLADLSLLTVAMGEARPDIVFHLAALADVRNSLQQSSRQIQENLVATHHVLEAMRFAGCRRIAFSSSAVVYGNQTGLIREDHTAVEQTSVYGAMKLASEALIQAYCKGYDWQGDLFRFVSILGSGYKHGNLMDFYQKLRANPSTIQLLGTGQELKYYVAAQDAVGAMLVASQTKHQGCETWNVSADDPVKIDENVSTVAHALGVTPTRTYEGGRWAGDLPSLVLSTTKLRAIGWRPTISTVDAMWQTVQSFLALEGQEKVAQ